MERGGVLTVLLLGLLLGFACSSPPQEPVACADGGCIFTNAYGSFPDRTVCRAASATFPTTEEELVAAVADAAKAKRKVKVVTKHSHSWPKLSCPGGDDGTIIGTKWLNRTVSVDVENRLMTVESGMVLRDLIQAAAAKGLALPHSPYWYGMTIGGLLATGAHGSSLQGKGGAVHEYVVGMRIVTPAAADQGFARVRVLGANDADLDAAKVSLGVLGVVSQVTLKLQPLFKRSVTFETLDDKNLTRQAAAWGGQYEFGDMAWLPEQRKVIYRKDNRVDVNSTGDGLNDYLGFRPTLRAEIIAASVAEQHFDDDPTDAAARCGVGKALTSSFQAAAYGFTNDGRLFTGYPVVGFQHRIQASGTCIGSPEDGMLTSCPWDPRAPGLFLYTTAFSIALSKAPAFIADMQRLRDLNPSAFCDLDAKLGILMRYIKASSAYLGKPEDSIDFDVTYYRSRTKDKPRAHSDVLDELEQMAHRKYGALPHWGKNRNFAFDGVIARYPKAGEFLKVKDRYDPDGIFSNEWTDQVLGIQGSPIIVGDHCAIEGLCICSDNSHCAPKKGYSCQPGKVYKEARVCSKSKTAYT